MIPYKYALRRRMMGEVDSQKLWLYNEGDECSALTGGWAAYPYTTNPTDNPGKSPVLTKGVSSMYAKLTPNSGKFNRGVVMTNSAIDLSAFNVLKIHVVSASIKSTAYTTSALDVVVTTTKGNSYPYNASKRILAYNTAGTATVTDTVFNIDISAITAASYVLLSFGTQQNYTEITFDKVWLEQ